MFLNSILRIDWNKKKIKCPLFQDLSLSDAQSMPILIPQCVTARFLGVLSFPSVLERMCLCIYLMKEMPMTST